MSNFNSKFPLIAKVLQNFLNKSYPKLVQYPLPMAAEARAETRSCATQKNVSKTTEKPKQASGGAAAAAVGSKCGGAGRGAEPPKKKFKHIVDKCDMFEIPKGHIKPYRTLSYCLMSGVAVLTFIIFSQQEEHETHYIPYEYMYKRVKRPFWGDHRKSFFHGPNNKIPDEEDPVYKKLPDPWEEDLKRRKELRDLNAKEELERRRQRREQEQIDSTS